MSNIKCSYSSGNIEYHERQNYSPVLSFHKPQNYDTANFQCFTITSLYVKVAVPDLSSAGINMSNFDMCQCDFAKLC